MRLLLPFLFLPCLTISGQAVDLVLGHFEYQIDYALAEGDADEGWKTWVSYDLDGSFADNEGVERLPLDSVRLLAAPSTRIVPSTAPENFGTSNEPLWILSQNNVPGELFLGWRAIYSQGLFQAKVGSVYSPSQLGSIESSLVEVTGTGPERGGDFAMWTTAGLGRLIFHFNTSDGISSDDLLTPVPAGSHSHYNWGFTQPGTYSVRFRNEGRLNPQFGGSQTQSEALLNFVVPHDGFLTGEGQWRLGDGANEVPSVGIYDSERQVDYAADQVALIARERQFEMSLADATAASLGRVGLASVDEIHFPGNEPITVSLLEQFGPGDVSMSLSENRHVFSFAADGIYRLRFQANQGGLVGTPFTLTFLVNLPIDYSYEDWAGSFERTHELEAGLLTDSLSDFDQDGLSNGLEFLLFWHGFDPVTVDAHLMPRPRFVNGRAEFEFLRDLHKDDFSSTPLELAVSFSPDLATPWKPWRRLFSEGAPDEFYEDGNERGNETSCVMRRRLVVPEATENFGFFRFEQRLRN